MARKRKKINRKKHKAPTPSIVEYSASTAHLIAQMVKMAGENDCVEDAFNAFRHELQENLEQHHRDLIQKLMYECYEEFRDIRGSEKSSVQSSTDDDATVPSTPEPVPKKEEKAIEPVKTTNWSDVNIIEKERSLFGCGVTEEEAPGKYWIDKLLEQGTYTKQDIVTVTQYHPDTVRKRITYIQKHIPQVMINKVLVKHEDSNQNTKEPVLRAEPIPQQ